jgi:uncharacterized damage-inducible protein DinB
MSTSEAVERYAAGGSLLAYATAGLTRDQETARPGPGNWSIAELVGHLLDADLVCADRMKRVLAEKEPVLLAFDETAWVARLNSQHTPVEEAVNLFVANRHWMTRILRNSSESDFSRAGLHSQAGRQTLAHIVANMVTHLDHHLRFLYGKRASLGEAITPRYAST